MRARLEMLRWRWRQIPGRIRLGAAIAIVAIAGLIWQHDAAGDAAGNQAPTHSAENPQHAQAQAEETAAAPATVTPDDARITATRFASNLASPNGSHDDWVKRLTPDTKADLLAQYQSTDITTVAQTSVTQVNGPMSTDPSVPTFAVSYGDGSRIQVTLELDATGWKVSSVVPVSPAAGPDTAPAVPAVAASGGNG